jgi:hypothetical protein
MAMIDIVYVHSAEPGSKDIRRTSIEEMKEYLRNLVFEMQMSDISSKFVDSLSESGKNDVLINGKTISQITDGLHIKMLESEDSCGSVKSDIIQFDRPTLDWNREYIEDVPDTIMKNAISKVYADVTHNRIL